MLDVIHHATVITQGNMELAPIHQYNVGMYSEYSQLMEKNLHDIFCTTLPWQRCPNGN